MLSELILIFIVGGIVALDTTAFYQSMISQPLVVCTFFGFIWGEVYTGAVLGIILEMIWLKLIPVGGFVSQQGNFGAFAASSSAIYSLNHFNIVHTDTVIFIFIIFSFFISLIAASITYRIRLMNRKIIHYFENKEINFIKKIEFIQITAIVLSFIINGLFLGFSFLLGVKVLGKMISILDLNLSSFAEVGIYSALGVGSGIILSMFWEKKIRYPFFVGLIIGLIFVILGFPL